MLRSIEERRLADFVDRVNEMRRFCEILETDERPILVVWGESGIGKSTLLAKMKHECALRKLRKAEVEFKETRLNDYLGIMRKVREDLGGNTFNAFTDLANYYFDRDGTYRPKLDLNITINGPISVLKEGYIEASTTGDIAGAMIKDNMFVIPRQDIAVPEAERMARLTECFINGLRETAANDQVIIFLDAVDKLSSDTEKWLWGELLDAVRAGRLSNVKFVLCGQEPPELDRDWRFFAEEAELLPLGLEHIKAYLSNRGIEEPERTPIAMLLLANTKGKVSEIANQVDLFCALKDKMRHDND